MHVLLLLKKLQTSYTAQWLRLIAPALLRLNSKDNYHEHRIHRMRNYGSSHDTGNTWPGACKC